MTTSAPQWPGQEGGREQPEEQRERSTQPVGRAVPNGVVRRLQAVPEPSAVPERGRRMQGPGTRAPGTQAPGTQAPGTQGPGRLAPGTQGPGTQGPRTQAPATQGPATQAPATQGPATQAPQTQALKTQALRPSGRRSRLVVVRDLAERELRAARRRARANLPPPAAVTRDIALALLEVEAGCRSAAQLERVFSRELWEDLERRIGRRGGPLPSGRSLLAVQCQEDTPGLADTVAVVLKGDLVRPVALRLDAGGGRWVVTELRWWRNETDTATTCCRDGGSS
jgi:Family of unknown function (DUF6459)